MAMQDSLLHWKKLIESKVPTLQSLSDSEFNDPPAPDKWSKKEILGHLIDSATNNHQRWVRAQFEPSPIIRYSQNLWVQHACHSSMQTATLIHTWEAYNLYLLEMVSLIPEPFLQSPVYQSDTPLTLENSIKDYVLHLEHHLQQIIPTLS